jgi:hypothetical protein
MFGCPNTTLIQDHVFFQFKVDINGPSKTKLGTSKEQLKSDK